MERTNEAYASFDGRSTIFVGANDTLDDDDSVAQLVFHELCHGLVQGPAGWQALDWGLSNDDPAHVVREQACLHVQIALSDPFGLRALLAPTTAYRAYHDAVATPCDPGDEAGRLARQALERPEAAPWLIAITAALRATAALLAAPPHGAARHPVGLPLGRADRTCGECAWLCVRWEPPVSCQECGACCREAYHSVTVAMRDPVVWKHPELIVRHGARFEVRREGERCAALEDRRHLPVLDPQAKPATFSCSIYDARPRPCREFEAGGRHCLVARRRVGLSHDDRR